MSLAKIPDGQRLPGVAVDEDGTPVPDGDAANRARRVVIVGGSVSISTGDYKKLYDRDATGNLLFEGWASPGSDEADDNWKIKAYAYDAQNNVISELWADGDSNFDNIWDDREELDYS